MIMVSEGVFRGHADTTAPALAAVSAACANIVLDPLFMFLLGWGMAGDFVAPTTGGLPVPSIRHHFFA